MSATTSAKTRKPAQDEDVMGVWAFGSTSKTKSCQTGSLYRARRVNRSHDDMTIVFNSGCILTKIFSWLLRCAQTV